MPIGEDRGGVAFGNQPLHVESRIVAQLEEAADRLPAGLVDEQLIEPREVVRVPGIEVLLRG